LPCIDYCFVRFSFLFFLASPLLLAYPSPRKSSCSFAKSKEKKETLPRPPPQSPEQIKQDTSLSFFSLSLSLSLSLWRHARSDRSPGTQTPPRTHTHTNKLSHINQLEDEILHHSPPFFLLFPPHFLLSFSHFLPLVFLSLSLSSPSHWTLSPAFLSTVSIRAIVSRMRAISTFALDNSSDSPTTMAQPTHT